MKVTPEHLATLREALAPLDTDAIRAVYARGDYPRAELTKDVNRRYRFDLFYAGMRGTARAVILAVVDAGDYSDEHLMTALRSFVPDIAPTD